MIIWLASYPRSGNTLLRSLLHQQFGLETFSDEPGEARVVGWTDRTKTTIGLKEISCGWDEFYQQALHSKEIKLIKTHRRPVDDSKSIYIVRDGRNSCVSYAKYHASFIKDKPLSLLALILGLDCYGGWSEHYRIWTQAQNTLLVLRYEELVAPSQATLDTIAHFLGIPKSKDNWENPFFELHRENPIFFREGRAHWQGAENWTELVDAIFLSLHGDLMVELGYVSAAEADQAIGRLAPEIRELLEIEKGLVRDLNSHRKICLERQIVIDGLKHACDERLVLIETLNKSLHGEP